MKAKVLIQFRGADFSQLFEKGNTYDFEQKRAEALAARGLVELIADKAEAPASKPEPKVDNAAETEVVAEVKAEAPAEETPKRGRKKAE